MSEKLLDLFLLILFSTVATGAHLLGHILAGLLAGERIEEVSFFYGKILFRIKTRIFPIAIGTIPTGGSVNFGLEFQNRSLPTRWFVIVSGPLAVLLTSAVVLRCDLAVVAFVSGFEQIFQGAFSPLVNGQRLVHQFFQTSLNTSPLIAYGIFAAKVSAFNLLPIPSFNGGRIITEAIPGFQKSNWAFGIQLAGILFGLVLFLCWVVAFLAYLWSS